MTAGFIGANQAADFLKKYAKKKNPNSRVEIITNGDVENEIKYLELLNPSIKKMQKKELFF